MLILRVCQGNLNIIYKIINYYNILSMQFEKISHGSLSIVRGFVI